MKNLLTLILTKTTLGLGLLLLSALSQAQTSQVYYIHTDHLNTPRLLSDSQGRERWRWEQAEGFGSNAPNEQPTATQPKVTFNLRYPGQYFDAETATHYNYFRDYNPQTGRYTTSDPIGLNGGINTYTYVENDPLRKVDPEGLSGGPAGRGTYYPNTKGPTPPSAAMQAAERISDALDKHVPRPSPDNSPPNIDEPWKLPKMKSYCQICIPNTPDPNAGSECRRPDTPTQKVGPSGSGAGCRCIKWGVIFQ